MLAAHGKTITCIAETEKYAHVTYFFNGEREEPVSGETRILIPSLPTKTYDKKPQMSASVITNAALQSLQNNPTDFYLINYANADMVGHSGNFKATVQAIECLDHELGLLYQQVVTTMGGTLLITADHGKAESMYDDSTHQPHTGHTTNMVPFLIITPDNEPLARTLTLTQLSDIAPFILDYMHLPIPPQMKTVRTM
jgi:2,3-bisphosphoglycerate-independent phosphoglycerate mutase